VHVAGKVEIGTSGWHYGHWRGPFYPARLAASKMLAFYCARFDTVEVNNSFYRLPSPEAVDGWREATPPGFTFAVKGSRFITHMKKLKDPEAALARFLPVIERLREKLGPILFQLPPRWRADTGRLEAFLRALPRRHRYGFELRDPTWLAPEIYAVLARHNAALCAYHLAGFLSPLEITADFAYVRLHGPGGKYQGSYSPAELEVWARRVSAWRRKLDAVYVYFDNDQAGHAAANALALKTMVG
jgi:uncharacterized protein YecE (DUF72 family)